MHWNKVSFMNALQIFESAKAIRVLISRRRAMMEKVILS